MGPFPVPRVLFSSIEPVGPIIIVFLKKVRMVAPLEVRHFWYLEIYLRIGYVCASCMVLRGKETKSVEYRRNESVENWPPAQYNLVPIHQWPLWLCSSLDIWPIRTPNIGLFQYVQRLLYDRYVPLQGRCVQARNRRSSHFLRHQLGHSPREINKKNSPSERISTHRLKITMHYYGRIRVKVADPGYNPLPLSEELASILKLNYRGWPILTEPIDPCGHHSSGETFQHPDFYTTNTH